jgi:hypothetical protein
LFTFSVYEKAETLCKEYASAKGLGTFARPAKKTN